MRERAPIPRSVCEQCLRVGGHASTLFTPCPPPGTCLEKLRGGRQLVPRRGQVACTIVSMGKAGAGACGLTRTCTVVAICHDRATCGFAVSCRAVRTAPSLVSGLIRTPTVVPNWHHRMTWSSTEPPTHHWSVPARRTNRTTMVLPNWQNHMTWADALGPSAGVQVSCRRRSPATAHGRPPPEPSSETNRRSTVPPIWRDRATWANVRRPERNLLRLGLDVGLHH